MSHPETNHWSGPTSSVPLTYLTSLFHRLYRTKEFLVMNASIKTQGLQLRTFRMSKLAMQLSGDLYALLLVGTLEL